jgi:hypothetical protein
LKFCGVFFTAVFSPLRIIGGQRLLDVRLGDSELTGNGRGPDARLEGGSNGIHFATWQGRFGDIFPPIVRNLCFLW